MKPQPRHRLILAPMITLLAATLAPAQEPPARVVGMYIHQHWPYQHPYAARTWTVDDYRGYCGGLKQLGYNTVMIWPVLETMPSPPTPSDLASLRKLAGVIDRLHAELGLRVYIALCPNVGPKSDEARKTTFERRHFFACDMRVNPADPEALGQLLQQRRVLLQHIAAADGVVIIDSDPGGYPGSTNTEFVHLLLEHRKLLDSLRPGIELVYWCHVGWPAYGRWYQTARFNWGTEAEFLEAMGLLKQADPKPWGLANGLKYAAKIGLADKVVSYNYGRIEGEPSMPMTRFDWQQAYAAGQDPGPRGVMGNAQTHCVQLPNTFAFARGATGQSLNREDFVRFAEQLIPGSGVLIVESWETLEGTNTAAMRASATRLDALPFSQLKAGTLAGLLFNDPNRFVEDLACMLRLKAAFRDFVIASEAGGNVKPALIGFTEALSTWHDRTGYENIWEWPKLFESLARLKSPRITQVLPRDVLNPVNEPGATPFDKVAGSMRRSESFTPDLLQALREEIR
jgi:hypothetical protein